jgi:hypothetical protein
MLTSPREESVLTSDKLPLSEVRKSVGERSVSAQFLG